MLTPLEKHLLLYSEQAFYYWHYATVADAPTLASAAGRLVADRGWEGAAPAAAINTLRRFNVWPEVGFGLARRAACGILPETTALCGEGAAQDAAMEGVFWLQGAAAAAVALAALLAAGGAGGSLVCLAAIVAYLNYATRVNTGPVLRENLAAPWLWLQTACLFALLLVEAGAYGQGSTEATAAPKEAAARQQQPKGQQEQQQQQQQQKNQEQPPPQGAAAAEPPADGATGYRRPLAAAYVACTTLLLLAWQFGPFLMLLQTVALFAAYCLNALPAARLVAWLRRMQVAGVLAAALMFGNTMVALSLWLCATVAIEVVLLHLPSDGSLGHNLMQGCIVAVGSLGMKHVLGRFLSDDDGHVYKLLAAHLVGYEDFMTGRKRLGQGGAPPPRPPSVSGRLC